ncbi:hypothetical protein FB45DRAFT_1059477 [Roridomyces roridus]|uniref:AB hydrolase-1 domain-containing protein n=1 Tax=Roridomyces roridus TaxID=1738132 RepID=A0AAD7FNB3_9AGAR|nr:hypothetical protein FB45DRAFT_1059477 [Roridomyces roridus]
MASQLLFFSLALIGAATPASSLHVPFQRRAENQTIRWLDCHTRIPPALQGLNITADTPLPSSLQCGEIDVPMDYSKPFDPVANNITVGFAMNRPANPQGVIYFHPGGPGIPAAPQAWENALNLSSTFTELMDDFDILGNNQHARSGILYPFELYLGRVFQRHTHPLYVSFIYRIFLDAHRGISPTSEEEYNAYQVAMRGFLASCNNTTPPGLMQFVSTAEFIQDMDTVRAALGYEIIHFDGVSYGTFVAAAYVARFPERVGRFVIDAVIPHGMAFQEMISDQVAATNRLLLRSDSFCMTDPTCPFYGQGKGSVVKAWETLLAQAIETPLAAPSCGPGTLCNAPVTATDLRFAVAASFRSDPDFPLFNFALNQSLHGNASLFGYQPVFDIRETVVSPLLCSDFPIEDSAKTFEGFNNFSINAQPNDTASIIYTQTWQLLLMCTAWPFEVPAQTPVTSSKEILWMTSDFDLNLPTELTTFAWQQTPNSTLLVRAGDGHTSIDLTGPAGSAAALSRNFLRTGSMPSPQDNTQVVTVIPPGGTRPPVPDPYDVPTGAVAGDVSVIENIITSSEVQNATGTTDTTGDHKNGGGKVHGTPEYTVLLGLFLAAALVVY